MYAHTLKWCYKGHCGSPLEGTAMHTEKHGCSRHFSLNSVVDWPSVGNTPDQRPVDQLLDLEAAGSLRAAETLAEETLEEIRPWRDGGRGETLRKLE
jgi:hypothetical protein